MTSSVIDVDGPTWQLVSRVVEIRLAQARSALESDLDPISTARQRGRIAELKYVLSIARADIEEMNKLLQDAADEGI